MQQRKRATAKKIAEDWNGQLAMEHAPKRMLVEPESSLQKRVMVALALAGALVWRNNTGAVKKGQRWIKYGLEKGSSDLVCLAPNGRAFFVEVKRQKFGLISEEQRRFIEKCRRWGAVAGTVTSVDEALALLEEAKRPAVAS
jgi:hypothetical protein